jgi:hypothetical protein
LEGQSYTRYIKKDIKKNELPFQGARFCINIDNTTAVGATFSTSLAASKQKHHSVYTTTLEFNVCLSRSNIHYNIRRGTGWPRLAT